ncbi:ABC transporter permease [Cohnella zeiphila]|uniref:ABC transporter permease n=1 Tax=Cohnella zeiphila TaxID=2761120 RepID=A0A7X0VZL0_9BACL|nr:ABC transporter permease [Cohnella zeiphila]MBB6734093.1 ABC transporter permease [Cohnella zeiphila]
MQVPAQETDAPDRNTGFAAEALFRLAGRKALLGILIPGLLLIVWQLSSSQGWIDGILYPAPTTIARAFYDLILSGTLWENLRISLARAAIGFALGGAAGLALGVLVGMSRRTEKVLNPSVQMIRMIPHLALVPLFVLWFGIGETSKVLIIAKGAFFPLYINAFIGIRNADNKLFEVARALEYSRWTTIRKLVIPSAMPNIILGTRLSLGLAWLGLVVAELMGATSGLGYLMSDARQFSQTPIVFVGIVLFAVIGKLADSGVRLVERRLLHWQDGFKGR